MMLKMKDTMEIIENLRYIEELISSPYINDNELLILDSLIKKHLVYISQNRPTLCLRENNMVHFSSAIRSHGSLCNIASLRYESFHQVAKKFCVNFNINYSQKYIPCSNDIVLITRNTEIKRLLSQRLCNKQVKSKYQLVKVIDDLDDNNFQAYILDFYCKISNIHFFDVEHYESNLTKFNITNLVSTKAEISQPLGINSGLCEIKTFFGTFTRFFDSDRSKHYRINVENQIKGKLFY
uniref:TH1 domain-containing protein n=1 Tax=Strongyloides venezuelensis TaxID=75913 RepID=A0A0K0FR64_STRVS